jgi:hypothetical protein
MADPGGSSSSESPSQEASSEILTGGSLDPLRVYSSRQGAVNLVTRVSPSFYLEEEFAKLLDKAVQETGRTVRENLADAYRVGYFDAAENHAGYLVLKVPQNVDLQNTAVATVLYLHTRLRMPVAYEIGKRLTEDVNPDWNERTQHIWEGIRSAMHNAPTMETPSSEAEIITHSIRLLLINNIPGVREKPIEKYFAETFNKEVKASIWNPLAAIETAFRFENVGEQWKQCLNTVLKLLKLWAKENYQLMIPLLDTFKTPSWVLAHGLLERRPNPTSGKPSFKYPELPHQRCFGILKEEAMMWSSYWSKHWWNEGFKIDQEWSRLDPRDQSRYWRVYSRRLLDWIKVCKNEIQRARILFSVRMRIIERYCKPTRKRGMDRINEMNARWKNFAKKDTLEAKEIAAFGPQFIILEIEDEHITDSLIHDHVEAERLYLRDPNKFWGLRMIAMWVRMFNIRRPLQIDWKPIFAENEKLLDQNRFRVLQDDDTGE